MWNNMNVIEYELYVINNDKQSHRMALFSIPRIEVIMSNVLTMGSNK